MKLLLLVLSVIILHLKPGNCAPTDIQKKFIYITLDDGPNEHTGAVLDLAKATGVPLTFFVLTNSVNLDPEVNSGDLRQNEVRRNLELLVRMLGEGHVIGDHSDNHMSHNSAPNSVENSYNDVEEDLRYPSMCIHISAFGAFVY